MPATFLLGEIVAIPGTPEALLQANQDAALCLFRHQYGDGSDCCEEDHGENEFSVLNSFQVLSAYVLRTGIRIEIITETDGGVTIIRLPAEC